MSIIDWLSNLADSDIAMAIRGDTGLDSLFPNVETLHVLALSMVFGTILMVDLRLLGVASRNTTVSKLSQEILPYTWTAFVLAAITGTLMFICNGPHYLHNLQFQLKFLCMLLAGINMAVFHFGAYRRVLQWDNSLPPPTAARVAGALSILLWIGVIFFGRWVGFTT